MHSNAARSKWSNARFVDLNLHEMMIKTARSVTVHKKKSVVICSKNIKFIVDFLFALTFFRISQTIWEKVKQWPTPPYDCFWEFEPMPVQMNWPVGQRMFGMNAVQHCQQIKSSRIACEHCVATSTIQCRQCGNQSGRRKNAFDFLFQRKFIAVIIHFSTYYQ